MRNSFTVIIFFVLCPILVLAQNSGERKWAASLIPSIIPVPENIWGIQPGIEYKISNRFRTLTELTFPLFPQRKDSSFLQRKYLRLKQEIRYILPYKEKDLFYIGLQMAYSFRSFYDADGGYYYDHLPRDSVYTYNSAQVNSPILSVSFQMGTLILDRKRISADFFCGAGPKFVFTQYSKVINQQVSTHYNTWLQGLGSSYLHNGNQILLYLNFGFRFFYHFNFQHKQLNE